MGYRFGDSGNMAVRVFLREMGALHDKQILGRPANWLETRSLKSEVPAYRDNKCAYCQTLLGEKFDLDHVVPINQQRSGLHCISNVVPVCAPCNSDKKSKPLDDFLDGRADLEKETVLHRIQLWEARWGGNPSGLHSDLAKELHSKVSGQVKSYVSLAIVRIPTSN